jgi:large subunit ribosomal protein L29
MGVKELREKSPGELADHLLDLRKEQFGLRMQQGSGQLTRPSQVKAVRREIARVKTIIAERVRGQADV